jgi:hypothetical protein
MTLPAVDWHAAAVVEPIVGHHSPCGSAGARIRMAFWSSVSFIRGGNAEAGTSPRKCGVSQPPNHGGRQRAEIQVAPGSADSYSSSAERKMTAAPRAASPGTYQPPNGDSRTGKSARSNSSRVAARFCTAMP